jgi:hypothetical protein
MSNKQGRIISIILISIAISLMMFIHKARADEIEDRCSPMLNNQLVCTNAILKKIAVDQELQIKHLRDISVILKEIAEQLALIREQLEGASR